MKKHNKGAATIIQQSRVGHVAMLSRMGLEHCSHIWIATGTKSATKPPKHQYRCKYCSMDIYSEAVIPPPECPHVWVKWVHQLGNNYVGQVCHFCGLKQINLIDSKKWLAVSSIAANK